MAVDLPEYPPNPGIIRAEVCMCVCMCVCVHVCV